MSSLTVEFGGTWRIPGFVLLATTFIVGLLIGMRGGVTTQNV
jgi:hypothetical protein